MIKRIMSVCAISTNYPQKYAKVMFWKKPSSVITIKLSTNHVLFLKRTTILSMIIHIIRVFILSLLFFLHPIDSTQLPKTHISTSLILDGFGWPYLRIHWRLSTNLKTSSKSACINVFWYVKVYILIHYILR